ncbi:unnamed protein product [Prunus armeniaca]
MDFYGGVLVRVNLEKRGLSSAVEKVWTFDDLNEVKVGGLCRFPMWDFVQVALVVTRVTESSFGSLGASAGAWHLGRISSFDRREGVFAFGASRFDAGHARLIMV